VLRELTLYRPQERKDRSALRQKLALYANRFADRLR
jgi:hypothetical protein